MAVPTPAAAWMSVSELAAALAAGAFGAEELLDLLLELASSMGSMPGNNICGLSDGTNWAIRTIMNKYRDEFESRVKPSFVAVNVTVGAGAKD